MIIKTIGQILLEKDIRLTNKQLKLVIESSQEYAEQFIELAAEEASTPKYGLSISKERILNIKNQIK